MNTILPFLYLNEYHSTISLLLTNTCIGISLVLVSRHRGWWSVHHTSYTIITTNLSVTRPCLRTTNKQCGDLSYLLSHFSLVSCLNFTLPSYLKHSILWWELCLFTVYILYYTYIYIIKIMLDQIKSGELKHPKLKIGLLWFGWSKFLIKTDENS